MQRPEAPRKIDRVNPDHRAVSKQFIQNAQGYPIIGIIKRRNQDRRIGDIKIGVACRKPAAVKVQGGRHGQWNDLDFCSILQRRVLQALPIFSQHVIIGITAVPFLTQHHGCRIHETTHVIYVPMGIVPGNALVQPDDVGDAQ